MDATPWIILTYETNSGEKSVDLFIKKQQSQARSKIIHNIRLLQEYGNTLGMPHAKMLGRGLYELRIRGKEELRILYFFKQRNIYLLHAFKKQKQQTPQKDIELAFLRMKDLT